MKVLVTGADGYIGAIVAPTLLERGHDVTGLDAGFYRSGWLFNDNRTWPHIVSKDIRQVTAEDLAGFDAVVHLAELSNDPLGEHDPKTTYDINHRGSVELAKKAKAAGVRRFVYTSSCSVYGAAEDGSIRDEISEPLPQTAYAKCKTWSSATSGRWPTRASARSFCATPPRSAPRRACASTSSSTTSPGSPGRRARSR